MFVITHCLWGVSSITGHGNHGCVRCAHSGWFLPFSYNPPCRLASRRGRKYVNISGEGTALPNWSPLGRRLHNPNLDRTPVYLLRETGAGFYSSSAHSVCYYTFSSLDTTTMHGTSLALPRDVSATAYRGQGRPSLRCICLQTQGRQVERCLCRLDLGAHGNKFRKRWLEVYHTILNTSSRMD